MRNKEDHMANQPSAKTAKNQSKAVQTTGGDKGSKKTNDFETSGRDRNVGKSAHHPENKGREGVDDEKVSRRGSTQGIGMPQGKRTTEAGVRGDNETKNHSQAAAQAVAGKKLRRTSKGERGSRKPGTELTKEEAAARKR